MDDLQMARGEVPGGWNLAVGEPVVLQKHLMLPDMVLTGPFPYPTMDGNKELLQELRHLHPEGHIVIANGAKQALSAAFYGYRKSTYKYGVYHEPPYWPSYPTLSRLSGMDFRATGSPIICGTVPNNPDGSETGNSVDVLDCVYAHWVYGWSGQLPKHEVAVYSASKLLGLTGVRVGWLVTHNPRLAYLAREYVEITTSGVCVPAQRVVARALRWMRGINPQDQLQAARDEMLDNGRAFTKYLGAHCEKVEGVPTTGQGMFAYFLPKNPALFSKAIDKAKVSLVSGAACGGNVNYWRMNMAQDNAYTEAALAAIKENL